MNDNRKNPFLFACGVPRSGTTLLQRMLDSHPDLVVANDSHFIPRALELTDKSLYQAAIAGQPIPLTDQLIAAVRDYHRFYRLGISDREFATVCQNATGYQELVAGIYDSCANQADKPLAGEKTPDYVRRLKFLHAMFPHAKLIHLIRDGRNVALSLMQWATPKKGPGRIALWKEQPVAVCAMWWRWLVLEGVEQATAIDSSSYTEIRYESLTEKPADQLRQLCRFLELPYDEVMTEYHRGKTSRQGGLSAKKAWLGPTTGLRDWRNDMPDQQVELFAALANDALQHFGYEISHVEFSDEVLKTAAECRSWWSQHFLARHQGPSSSTADSQQPTARGEQISAP